MEMVINRQKKELRQQLLSRLLSLTSDEIKRRSKNVEATLSQLPLFKKARVVAAYYPLKGEVDILGMIRKVIGQKRFCFPVMNTTERSLRFFEVSDLDRGFVAGPWGVMEPDTEKSKEVDIGHIEMVVVPGLAFDRHRNRLGRGAGFYDRFLATTPPSSTRIGVAFDFQVLENLPVHLAVDQKVDLVVAEHETL